MLDPLFCRITRNVNISSALKVCTSEVNCKMIDNYPEILFHKTLGEWRGVSMVQSMRSDVSCFLFNNVWKIAHGIRHTMMRPSRRGEEKLSIQNIADILLIAAVWYAQTIPCRFFRWCSVGNMDSGEREKMYHAHIVYHFTVLHKVNSVAIKDLSDRCIEEDTQTTDSARLSDATAMSLNRVRSLAHTLDTRYSKWANEFAGISSEIENNKRACEQCENATHGGQGNLRVASPASIEHY